MQMEDVRSGALKLRNGRANAWTCIRATVSDEMNKRHLGWGADDSPLFKMFSIYSEFCPQQNAGSCRSDMSVHAGQSGL